MQSPTHSLKIGDKVTIKDSHELGKLEILSLYSSKDLTAKALLSNKDHVCVCDSLEDLVLISRDRITGPSKAMAEQRQYLKDLIKSD